MQSAPQELLKQYVQSQHFTSTADIMAAMKEMFRDVIQQVMEVEMDEELGRERCQRAAAENTSPNYRNGYSQKTVKRSLERSTSRFPEIARATMSRRSSASTTGTLRAWRTRFCLCTPAV